MFWGVGGRTDAAICSLRMNEKLVGGYCIATSYKSSESIPSISEPSGARTTRCVWYAKKSKYAVELDAVCIKSENHIPTSPKMMIPDISPCADAHVTALETSI